MGEAGVMVASAGKASGSVVGRVSASAMAEVTVGGRWGWGGWMGVAGGVAMGVPGGEGGMDGGGEEVGGSVRRWRLAARVEGLEGGGADSSEDGADGGRSG